MNLIKFGNYFLFSPESFWSVHIVSLHIIFVVDNFPESNYYSFDLNLLIVTSKNRRPS